MRLISAASIYLGAGVVNKAIPFLLLPVLTHVLTPEEYGFLAIYQVLIAFCAPFVGMSMHINVSRNFAKVSPCEMAKWIGNLFNVLSVTTVTGVIVFSVYFFLRGPTFGLPGLWFVSVPIVAGLNMGRTLYMTVLRNQQRPYAFGWFAVSGSMLDMIASVVLVIAFGLGWQGRGIGIFGSAVMFGLLAFGFLWCQDLYSFNVDRKKVQQLAKVCLPLVPHALGVAVIGLSDRLFVEQMVGKAAVGIYTVGHNFGMVVSIFVGAFGNAWSPWFYRQMVNITNQGRHRIVRYSYMYFVGIILLAMLVTVVSQVLLPLVVATEYSSAVQYVLWIAVGYAFRGMYTIVYPYLAYEARTNFLGVMTGVAAVLNLVGNYFLISLNGPIGAAQSTALAFAVSFLGTWWYANRICPMPWGGRIADE
ncbi:oligosaccharide flippase family protein [Desulfogranum marinum]|uniref:lipopolysaccharide biosynthesis protein n=1 Tax=Desulfogranum marinum TaxID=453220 RepID=UPI0029C64C20|nr:oligosaccharide flippase family protein [Desulfogranum marinum]